MCYSLINVSGAFCVNEIKRKQLTVAELMQLELS